MKENDLDQEKVNQILQCVSEGVIYQEADGSIKFFNPAAQRIFGIGEEAAKLRTSEHPGWCLVFEDGSPCPAEEHPSMLTLRTGQALSDQIRGFAPPGQPVIWLSINTRPIFRPGQELPEAVVISFSDITKRKRTEMEMHSVYQRLQAMWSLAELQDADLKTISDHILEWLTRMTESDYGFYGFIDDEACMVIHSWSGNAMQECYLVDKPTHFPIEQAGVWAEAVRQRKPLILNDYAGNHPGKKGIPPGHVKLTNLLVVPHFSHGKIVSVAAVANRETPYHDQDISQIVSFLNNIYFIIERKRAKEELRASEERYRLIAEYTSDSIWAMDADLRFTYLSPSTEHLFGYTVNEWDTLEWDAFVHPDYLDTVRDIFEGLRQEPGKGSASAIVRVRHKNGRDIWVEFTASPVTGPHGELTGVVGVTRDITVRKATEDALRQSLQTAADLVGALPSGLFIYQYEPPDRLLLITGNPEAERLTGISEERYRGREFNEIWHQAREAGITGKCLEVVRTGQAYETEDLHYQDDRLSGAYRIRAFVLPGQRLAVAFEDITARKRADEALRQSERRFRTVAGESLLGIYETDAKGDYIYVNDRWCDFAGMKAEEAMGLGWVHGLHPDDLERISNLWYRHAESSDPWNFEYRFLTPQGKTTWVLGTAIPLRNEQGEITGYLGSNLDITERKRAEHKLRDQQRVLSDILEDTLSGYWDWNIKEGTEYLSPTFKKMFGYQDHELPNSPETWQSLIFLEDLPGTLENFDKHVRTRGEHPYHNEVRYRHKNGSTVWVICAGRVIEWADDGTPIRMVGCHVDITNRKLAEEELCHKTALLEALANSTIEGILVVDSQGKKVFENKRAIDLWKIPQHIADSDDDKAQVQYVMHATKHPEQFAEKVAYLYNHPNETSRDEIELLDGTVLDRYSAPVLGEDGQYFGRIWTFRDITERKQSEEALRASEEKYRQLAESIPGMVFQLVMHKDTSFSLSYVNQRIMQYAGVSPESAMTEPSLFFTPIHPDDQEMVRLAIFTSAETLQDLSVEHRLIDVNGQPRWFSARSRPQRLSNGDVIWNGVSLDITEHKKTEERLADSEELHRTTIENISDTVIITDDQGTFSYICPTTNLIFGRTPDEALALGNISALFGEPLVDIDELNRRTEISNVECTVKDIHGREYFLLVNIKRVSIKNGTTLYSCRDITDRKEAEIRLVRSEEELRWLFKSMINAFVIFDSVFDEEGKFISYRFVYINDAYERITGVKNKDVLGKTVHEVWPATEPSWVKKYGEVAVSGIPQTFDMYHDPTNRLYHCNVYRPYETASRFCVIFEDITERKKAEEEKEKMEAQLNQAQKLEAVGRLAGGVAHDFNNMLSIIIGHAEMLLEETSSDEPSYHDITEIRNAAQRSAELTRQLLAFARKQSISPKILDLNETAFGILKMLRRLIGEDIELGWFPGLDLWPVEMDPGQIDQILANLAVNARDAIGGVGTMTIETANVVFDETHCQAHKDLTPGSYAMLAVSDTGAGMDKETLDRIFEPFFTTKELGKGTGLGLATVYGIVKQNHGGIDVYSEPGQGTTFKIYLPRAEKKVEEKPAETTKRDLRGTEIVLLVEDEESILALGKSILERRGYTVLTARSPGESLKMLMDQQGPIHLLITDVVMPEMNGRDLRDKLLEVKSGFKTIFMSGYTANVIAHHGVLDEGVNFLQKPFSVQTLLQKVRDVLDG